MGFKIKNSLTGEFEKLPILTLKGEKGETGGVEEYNKVDYMGNKYETLKQANDANVEYAVKTAIGEFNYLDYEGQNITATNTLEGRSKSAILKGQTLVNLHRKQEYRMRLSEETQQANKYENIVEEDNHISCNMVDGGMYGWGSYIDLGYINVDMLKPNTKYLVWFELATVPAKYSVSFMDKSSANPLGRAHDIPKGQNYAILTTADEIIKSSQILYISFHQADVGYYEFKNAMIIEYQEGMENWDIPYFEGMASVKAPVLHSVGKNLCKYRSDWVWNGLTFTNTNNGVTVNGTASTYVDYYVTAKSSLINVETLDELNRLQVGTRLFMSNNLGKNSYISYKLNGETNYAGNVTIQNGMEIIGAFVRFQQGDVCNNLNLTIQLEIGNEATTYEPYKSNILSTPQDLELRGIGNVKDELNLATGELTQRIGEIVLDDSNVEGWRSYETKGEYLVAKFTLPSNALSNGGAIPSVNVKCDKMKVETVNQEGSQEQVSVYHHGTNGNYSELRLCLLTSKLTSADIEGIKTYVKNNPFTIQYQLKTESVKTVDLSDNHVYSYKDTTHYACSSAEGSLVPTLSVKVPTDVQATIAQQRETIQTLNSENERLNQIQEALKASMLDSQVQLMNLSWNTDFEVFTLRESIATKDSLMDSRTGSNIDKFSQAKFIIENDCPDLEKLNSQIEYYFSKDVFSQEQFEELTDLISIVKGENGCEY